MIRKCPNHGINKSMQVQYFYIRLNPTYRMSVDKASNGSIILKSPNEVEELYGTMIANNALCPFRRATYKKLSGIHEIDAISKLLEQIFSLEKNVIDHLTLKNPSNVLQIKLCYGIRGRAYNSGKCLISS